MVAGAYEVLISAALQENTQSNKNCVLRNTKSSNIKYITEFFFSIFTKSTFMTFQYSKNNGQEKIVVF